MKSMTLLTTVCLAINAGLLLSAFAVQSDAQDAKIRVAVVGLDHDPVGELRSLRRGNGGLRKLRQMHAQREAAGQCGSLDQEIAALG